MNAVDTRLALVPKTIADAEVMAVTLAKSGMLPDHFKGRPADVFWAISFGLEVGLGPVASLNSVYVVHGKPGLYADAMVALVLSSGLCKYFRRVSSDDKEATYETLRFGDDKPTSVTVTMAQAERAGWAKQNAKYQTEPRRMLEARAKSWLAKDCYPDVLRGVAAVEELRDEEGAGDSFRPAAIRPAAAPIDVESSEAAATSPKDLLERVLAASTLADLDTLLPELAKVPAQAKAELRSAYGSKKRQLQAAKDGPDEVAAPGEP